MAIQKETVDLLLAEGFKELACQQPIEKITIKAITDKAGVIRPTFYNHFQDKYELLEWIIRVQVLEPAKPLIAAGMVDEAFILIFTTVQKEKAFYEKAVRLEGHYAQSMCFVVVNWIKGGMAVEPKEITDIYNYMITRSMSQVIEEL